MDQKQTSIKEDINEQTGSQEDILYIFSML